MLVASAARSWRGGFRAGIGRPRLATSGRHLAVISAAAVSCALLLGLLVGCGRTGRAAEGAQSRDSGDAVTAAAGDDEETVVLPPEMAKRLGVITTQAQAVTFAPSAEGFGVVLGHDS